MRLLALSDIHGNDTAVRELRGREINSFDAVILAGDIGEGADTVLGILASFGCPVLYVYGNWDGELEYNRSFGSSCTHLHLRVVDCGQWSFAGFSGCSVGWGRNPIADMVESRIRKRHRAVLDARSECETASQSAAREISLSYDVKIQKLAARTRDRRTSPYRTKVRKLEDERDSRIARAKLPLGRIEASREYVTYQDELLRASTEIGALNRRRLAETIKASGSDPKRTVVVTHERLYRTAEDLPGVPIFLFGHKHGFRETIFRGSRYVNVSALDLPVTVHPALEKNHPNPGYPQPDVQYRNANRGNYVIIEGDPYRWFDVRCVRFQPDLSGWTPASFLLKGAEWL